jgi:HPt (histidine-containing phosphotransfer) domain-containing protein
MFLSNGFDGFISKPIDINEMYRILKEWLPLEKIEIKREKTPEQDEEEGYSEFLQAMIKIDEINVEVGLSRVSGMENMYKETLELFNRKLIPECDAMYNMINYGDINGFSISVHAMKSALSTIGAMSLSETALRLETSAKDNDFGFCVDRFPSFRNKLVKLHEELSAIFPQTAKKEKRKKNGDKAYLNEKIEKALKAADDFEGDEGLSVINDLLTYDFGERNNDMLESVAKAFKDFNFSDAAELLSKLR